MLYAYPGDDHIMCTDDALFSYYFIIVFVLCTYIYPCILGKGVTYKPYTPCCVTCKSTYVRSLPHNGTVCNIVPGRCKHKNLFIVLY